MTEDEAIRRILALSEAVFRTEDAREGVRAFFAKVPPRWQHR
jgi:enoyl-CoA hydratase/carnithine racemase